MASEDFAVNLMKMIAAEVHFLNAQTASREMFARSYFSLGAAEKIAVDQAVFGHVAANYNAINPEFLAGQAERQPMGFGIPKASEPTPNSSGGAS
jgi:hypothetical protein